MRKSAAGKFPDDEGMAKDLSFVEQGFKLKAAVPEMLDPYGRIDEDHRSPGVSKSRRGSPAEYEIAFIRPL